MKCQKQKAMRNVDQGIVTSWNWSGAEEASSKLHDFLCIICDGEAQTIIEKTPGQGFEADNSPLGSTPSARPTRSTE